MIYASDIIGKKVISLYESEFLGTVHNIYLNKKRNKIAVYEILNKKDEKEYLNTNDIFSVGNAVILKSSQHLISSSDFDFQTITQSLINKEIYSTKGNFLGKVCDIVLKNFKEANYLIITNSNTNVCKEYKNLTKNISQTINENHEDVKQNSDTIILSTSINDFVRFGDVLIMQEGEKINFASLRPRINLNSKNNNQKVYALYDTENSKNTTHIKTHTLQKSSSTVNLNNKKFEQDVKLDNKYQEPLQNSPSEILANLETIRNFNNAKKLTPLSVLSSNYEFLIGRKADKNILASNKEVIIKKNSKITQKHIELANNYNKLRELAMFSK